MKISVENDGLNYFYKQQKFDNVYQIMESNLIIKLISKVSYAIGIIDPIMNGICNGVTRYHINIFHNPVERV